MNLAFQKSAAASPSNLDGSSLALLLLGILSIPQKRATDFYRVKNLYEVVHSWTVGSALENTHPVWLSCCP